MAVARPILGVVLAVSAWAAPVLAQPIAPGAIDAIFQPLVSSTSPGCAVAAAKDGKKVVERAYGLADIEHGVANSPSTIFEAGSASKQFTAAAILLLAEEGKLSLDDDVRKYLPEIPNYGATITIDHLLHHTSGMRDWRFLRGIGGQMIGEHVNSNADALDSASRQSALNHAPGAEYAYTNTGYNLAAIIVQRVSGQTLADYTKKKIFDPLGMASTQWRDNFRRIVKGRAIAYARGAGGFEWAMPFENAYGSGGLLTTVGDLLLWNEALAQGRLGPRVTARLQEQGALDNGTKIDYARGLFIETYRSTREISHGGVTLGYVAFLARYPEHKVSVAVLCNGSIVSPREIAHGVADLLLPSTLPAESAAVEEPASSFSSAIKRERWLPSRMDLQQLVGRYYSSEVNAAYDLRLEGGQLVMALEGSPDTKRTLSPTYRDTFVFLGGNISFVRMGTDVKGLSLSANRIRALPFTKQALHQQGSPAR